MKLSANEVQLVLQALNKHKASINRLMHNTRENQVINEAYKNEMVKTDNLINKIATGQGALTL